MNLQLTARGQDHDIQQLNDAEAVNLNFESLYRQFQQLSAALNAYQINLGTDIAGILPSSALGAGVPPSTSKFYREDGIFAVPTGGGGGMSQAGFRRMGWSQMLDATSLDIGGATTFSGTSANVKDAEGFWRRLTSAASISSSVSWTMGTNVAMLDHRPTIQWRFRTGSVVSNLRFWASLAAGTPNDNDVLSSAGIALRYSTTVPDAGFVPVVKGSSTPVTGTAIGTFTANTNYLVELKVLDPSTATFTVYSGNPLVLAGTTTLAIPASALGAAYSMAIILYTRDAVAKVMDFTRSYFEAS